jgi:hypothetical protein
MNKMLVKTITFHVGGYSRREKVKAEKYWWRTRKIGI